MYEIIIDYLNFNTDSNNDIFLLKGLVVLDNKSSNDIYYSQNPLLCNNYFILTQIIFLFTIQNNW